MSEKETLPGVGVSVDQSGMGCNWLKSQGLAITRCALGFSVKEKLVMSPL